MGVGERPLVSFLSSLYSSCPSCRCGDSNRTTTTQRTSRLPKTPPNFLCALAALREVFPSPREHQIGDGVASYRGPRLPRARIINSSGITAPNRRHNMRRIANIYRRVKMGNLRDDKGRSVSCVRSDMRLHRLSRLGCLLSGTASMGPADDASLCFPSHFFVESPDESILPIGDAGWRRGPEQRWRCQCVLRPAEWHGRLRLRFMLRAVLRALWSPLPLAGRRSWLV